LRRLDLESPRGIGARVLRGLVIRALRQVRGSA